MAERAAVEADSATSSHYVPLEPNSTVQPFAAASQLTTDGAQATLQPHAPILSPLSSAPQSAVTQPDSSTLPERVKLESSIASSEPAAGHTASTQHVDPSPAHLLSPPLLAAAIVPHYPPVHPLVSLLHSSMLSFDALYSSIAQHDASQAHYIHLVLPLTPREMADKLQRIEMVAFELGMAQSNAMRVGRELDVMGGGMERVREKWNGAILDSVIRARERDGVKWEEGSEERDAVKRRFDEVDTNGQGEAGAPKLPRLASDAG